MSETPEIRISTQALKVLRLFLENVRSEHSGAEIAREAKVGPGTLYPMLSRFEKAGLFEARWEEVDPSEVGRPRRRLYKITGAGIRCAQTALSEVQVSRGVPSWT